MAFTRRIARSETSAGSIFVSRQEADVEKSRLDTDFAFIDLFMFNRRVVFRRFGSSAAGLSLISRLLQQVAPRIETIALSQAEGSASINRMQTWAKFDALLTPRGHRVSQGISPTGLRAIGVDDKKIIPIADAWNMWNLVVGMGFSELGQARMLEELVNRYPIDSEKPDSTPPPSDV